MYELKSLLWFIALLGGFAMVYVLVSYLRHKRLPALWQALVAMLLAFCLFGLACAIAGVYMLWVMRAMSPLTLLIVGIPTLVFSSLGILALTYMRSNKLTYEIE